MEEDKDMGEAATLAGQNAIVGVGGGKAGQGGTKGLALLHAFMSGCRYGVVSSLARDGAPQSALVGIAIGEELEIIFDTVTSSRKYGNLVSCPSCSFVVGGWSSEQTVQYEGIAEELKGEDLARYQGTYFAVWPDGPARMSWPGIAYFVVRPVWIRYSDFDQSPPRIEETRF